MVGLVMITIDDLNYKQKGISFELVDILDNIQKQLIGIREKNPNTKSKFYTGVGSRQEKCLKYNQINDVNLMQMASDIGFALAARSYVLRSGGATGMDSYFESGVNQYMHSFIDRISQNQLLLFQKSNKLLDTYPVSLKDIGKHLYLRMSDNAVASAMPDSFAPATADKLVAEIFYAVDADKYVREHNDLLFEMVKLFHPAPQHLKKDGYPIKLLARNIFQLFGSRFVLDNNYSFLTKISDFVICFTPDGCINHKTRGYSTGGTGQLISYADFFGVPVYNLSNYEQMVNMNLKSRIEAFCANTVLKLQ